MDRDSKILYNIILATSYMDLCKGFTFQLPLCERLYLHGGADMHLWLAARHGSIQSLSGSLIWTLISWDVDSRLPLNFVLLHLLRTSLVAGDISLPVRSYHI